MSCRLSWPPVVRGRYDSSRHEVVLGETDRANVEALARSMFPDRPSSQWNLCQVVRCALERAAHQLAAQSNARLRARASPIPNAED